MHVEPLPDGRSAVLLDRTAFHAVDTAWPDQPADRGVLRVGESELAIRDGVTGGIHDGTLLLGRELPVRMGTEGWTFVVGHVIEGPAPAVGSAAEVEVDAGYRAALSAGHTACHLASLALDAALRDGWTKEAPTDALGNPAFDALACQSSRIEEYGSTDVYRIGKSLRRKGFDPAVLDDVTAITARANELLAGWVGAGAPVHIERSDQCLSSRRTWVCELPERRVEIPCGGTHVRDLSELGEVTVSLVVTAVDGGLELTMTTTAANGQPDSGQEKSPAPGER